MKYLIVCDVSSSSDISIKTISSQDVISCPVGTLQVIEYSPSISELSSSDRADLVGLFFLFILLGYIAGISGKAIITFIYKSLGWN